MRISATGGTANPFYISKDYDSSEAASTSSVAGGSMATMEGIITASTSGNLIARFGVNIATNTLTARAGSVVFYQRIN